MELPILYKRAKTGKIVYWAITIIPRFNNGNGGFSIHKETGQVGTDNPIEHDELITVGKQKRTAQEQAGAQALSDWKKKKDEGYKESVEELDSFNTDASGNVKPMLAHEAKKHEKKVVFPCMVQPKFDGVRATIGKQALSRQGKEFTTLKHIQDELIKLGTQDVILDGEIYSDELTFQEIISALKKYRADTLKLKYRVYDILNSETATVRQCLLENNIKDSSIVVNTGYSIVHSWDEIREKFAEYISQGYEGLMIRSMQGLYGFGQRSYDLLKYKEFDEEEFQFLNWEVGKRDEDLIAVLLTSSNKEFKAKMVGTVKEKQELQTSLPKLVTVKYFGLTDDGIPRFPIGKTVRDYE